MPTTPTTVPENPSKDQAKKARQVLRRHGINSASVGVVAEHLGALVDGDSTNVDPQLLRSAKIVATVQHDAHEAPVAGCPKCSAEAALVVDGPRISVNVGSVNAALHEIGREDITITERDVVAAGMTVMAPGPEPRPSEAAMAAVEAAEPAADRSERARLAKLEAAAVKDAGRMGVDPPATPNLDAVEAAAKARHPKKAAKSAKTAAAKTSKPAKVAAPKVTGTPRSSIPQPGSAAKLPKGGLVPLVVAAFADMEELGEGDAYDRSRGFSPSEIGKYLGRSAGAVSNVLDKLAADGKVVVTSAKPRRFALPA